MDVGSSTSTEMLQNSQEFLGAALSKKQQVADGEAALKLLESATVTSPAASSPAGSIGANISVKV